MLQTQSRSSPRHTSNVRCGPLVPPAMFYPLYPSSTLHNYYSVPPSHQNFMHISSPPLFFSPALYQTMHLPSTSQSHVPTIRGTPPPFPIQPLESNNVPHTSLFVQYRSPLLSPLQFPQLFSSSIMNNLNSPCIHIQIYTTCLTMLQESTVILIALNY